MRTRGAERGAQVSEDETEAEWAECSQCAHQGWMGTYCPQCEDQRMTHSIPGPRKRIRGANGKWKERLARGLQRLTRSRKAGNELPSVGQGCLVLRGVEGHDLGQPAIVTMQTKARVRILYIGADGRPASKLKQPSSLILVEDGLEMVQDEHGFVWVKRSM